MEITTRREFLKNAGAAALGMATGVGVTSLISCAPNPTPTVLAPVSPTPAAAKFPWTYVKLDAVAVAEKAYADYSKGACMYGTFSAIIGTLAQQVGAPFSTFPMDMMKYGKGGVYELGTLCGALNGAAAAISLVADTTVAEQLIDELFAWYNTEALPDYKPKTPKYDIVASVSNSPLCHVSVTEWSNKSGFNAYSPQRAERCGWLAASVAKQTTELLNSQADNTFKRVHTTPADVTTCLACHGQNGAVQNVHVKEATSCTLCHTDLSKHPVPIK